jgi:molecular chaperone DnaK
MVDAKNQADSMIYQTEKNLKEYKDRLEQDDVKKLEKGIEDIQATLRTENAEEIKGATEKLNSVWQEVAQKMYQSASTEEAQQATGTGGPGGPEPGAGEAAGEGQGPGGEGSKVVDADYEIIDDDKK